ncbi:MAG: FG-GAP repeat protein, partial [Rhizobiaceae bacterium]|nr:FG-GAP repeat protein [Rhizobiaceae bacterium]
TPDANFFGADSFTYKANDGTADGNTVTVSLTVTAANDAPVAVADSYTVDEDGTLTVAVASGVLANDSDADDDALTAVLVADVAHGSLTLSADGSFVYTPAADFFGSDSFTYKANDGAAGGNTVTVSLSVANTGIPAPQSIDLDDIAGGSGGFKIIGENAGDYAGHRVSSAGDVNGDGLGDLIVGAYANGAGGDDAGAAYLVFGAATSPASIDLDDIAAGIGGFRIIGEYPYDYAGYSVSSVGDINGDGFDDLVVGAYANDAGSYDAGAAYVVFGAATSPASVNLDDIAAGNGGFKIIGENAGDYAGWSVSSAGDVNGDGFGDLIVGAQLSPTGGLNAGAAYLVFGAATSPASIDLDDIAAGIGGFRIIGEYPYDYAGYSVSSAGDVNGDGFDDLIVGAYGNDGGGTGAGAAYVVFGAATSPASVNLDDIAAGNGGFKIIGETINNFAGWSVSSAGDVNGDGFDDLIVGAYGNDAGGSYAGAAYLIFGTQTSPVSIDLNDIAAGNGGFKITGENAEDYAGQSVSSAGDVNGDGFDDLIVGAFANDAGGNDAGAAYTIYGGDWVEGL